MVLIVGGYAARRSIIQMCRYPINAMTESVRFMNFTALGLFRLVISYLLISYVKSQAT